MQEVDLTNSSNYRKCLIAGNILFICFFFGTVLACVSTHLTYRYFGTSFVIEKYYKKLVEQVPSTETKGYDKSKNRKSQKFCASLFFYGNFFYELLKNSIQEFFPFLNRFIVKK